VGILWGKERKETLDGEKGPTHGHGRNRGGGSDGPVRERRHVLRGRGVVFHRRGDPKKSWGGWKRRIVEGGKGGVTVRGVNRDWRRV